MSCHFHRVRRMKAAKAAQEAKIAAQSEAAANLDEEPVEDAKAAQEANEAPKKAPKKKGDAK